MTDSARPPVSDAQRSPRTLLAAALNKLAALLKNIVCFAAWSWLVYRVAGRAWLLSTPYDYVSSLCARIPSVAWVSAVVFLFAVLVLLKKLWWIARFMVGFFFRLLFFPIVLLYYSVTIPFGATKVVSQAANVVLNHVVRTSVMRASLTLAGLLSLSTGILVGVQSQAWIPVAIALLLLVLLIVLRLAVLLTERPLLLTEQLLPVASRICDWFHRVIEAPTRDVKDPDRRAEVFDAYSKQVDSLLSTVARVEQYISRQSEARVVARAFSLVMLGCLAATVASFGLILMGIDRMHPGSFDNLQGHSLLSYCYASLMVITTSSDIHPVLWSSKLAVAMEVVVGLALLSWLLLHFQMSLPDFPSQREKVLEEVRRKRHEVERSRLSCRRILRPESEIAALEAEDTSP